MLKSINPYRSIFSDVFGQTEQDFGVLDGLILTWRNPYDSGYSTTYARQVQFTPGVTVLVGCNGSGKSTLLRNIKDSCHRKHVAYLFFDNLHDGGSNSIESAMYNDNMNLFTSLWTASEGEAVSLNIASFANKLGYILHNDYKDAKEIWLLFDAADSGLSVDNVVELKQLFDLILQDQQQRNVYIVIAANEYELASGMNCLDVMSGKFVTFCDYDDYRKFILKSRKRKDDRIKKAAEKQKKNHSQDEEED